MVKTVIIAVSDVHLGYTKQKDDFKNFLDYIKEKEVHRLVIIGDFLDMWRRDIAGVVIQNTDILRKLEELQNQNKIIDIIAGNHDYHIKNLKKEYGYQFSFHESGLDIVEYGKIYSFYHGYEFDNFQNEAYFEALCYTSDVTGEQFSDFWEYLQKGDKFWQRFLNFFRKKNIEEAVKAMLTPPEQRLEKEYDKVRRKALKEKEDKGKDFLIYGHTHEPFVDQTQTIANTGSWVKPEIDPGKIPHYNTYLEIYEDSIILKKWVKGKEEMIKPKFSTTQLERLAKLW